MKKKSLFQFIVLFIFLGTLSGCGQSGPLYHPGQKTPYGP